jgi:hypothetical protein
MSEVLGPSKGKFYSKGIVSSFKTRDFWAFQKLNPKAQKTLALKCMKGNLKNLRGVKIALYTF